jgi:putative flippase GtrA
MGEMKLFFGYLIIGGLATLVDIGFLKILTDFVGIWYIYSVIIAYVIGAVVHYTLNKYVNFKNKSKRIIIQFSLFLIISLIGLLINISLIYMLVEFIDIWYIYAKIIATAIAFVSNYFLNRNITFRLLK